MPNATIKYAVTFWVKLQVAYIVAPILFAHYPLSPQKGGRIGQMVGAQWRRGVRGGSSLSVGYLGFLWLRTRVFLLPWGTQAQQHETIQPAGA